jgi:hypothetical protein
MTTHATSVTASLISAGLLAFALGAPAHAANPCAPKTMNPCAAKNPCAARNP